MTEENRNDDGLMEVADVVRYTKLSEGAIRKRVTRGTIPVVRIGRRVLFRRDDIDRWIDAHADGGEAA